MTRLSESEQADLVPLDNRIIKALISVLFSLSKDEF